MHEKGVQIGGNLSYGRVVFGVLGCFGSFWPFWGFWVILGHFGQKGSFWHFWVILGVFVICRAILGVIQHSRTRFTPSWFGFRCVLRVNLLTLYVSQSIVTIPIPRVRVLAVYVSSMVSTHQETHSFFVQYRQTFSTRETLSRL